MEADDKGWTSEERALWSRIAAHPFEDPSIALDFTRRFARQLGWPLETARQAITEYRRFCFLAMVTRNGPVTPSEEVDEVWHLHLTFTRDYWDRWCGQALGRPLHHDPTEGGPAEGARYRAQYAETLALYERYFGPPPEAFWPGTAQRFGAAPRYRQVDATRVVVLPRPRLPRAPLLAGLVALLWSSPASAQEVGFETTWNLLNWTGTPFLTLYAPLVVVAIALAYVLSAAARRTGLRTNGSGLDTMAIAYLIGGPNRAADTLLIETAIAGRASIEKRIIRIEQDPNYAPDRLEPFGSLPAGGYKRPQLLKYFAGSARATAIRNDLERRNLFLSEEQARRVRTAILVPLMPVFLLGGAKIAVGASRGKPIGFLILLMVICAIANAILQTRGTRRTREGSAVARELRSDRSRAVRAPLQGELPLAFALLGAPVLAGSEYAPLAKQIAASGCGGGGDGGGGCGGGGGGGGGCGGCGGH